MDVKKGGSMGEQYQFYCPGCDHVDTAIGECPECGGNLRKLEEENGDLTPQNLSSGELDLAPESAGYDDYIDTDFDDEGLQTTY